MDITDKAGARHRHEKVMLDKKLERIMPWMASVGACAAACDYNKEGWIDLYVSSSKLGSLNRLLRNQPRVRRREGAHVGEVAAGQAAHAGSERQRPLARLGVRGPRQGRDRRRQEAARGRGRRVHRARAKHTSRHKAKR